MLGARIELVNVTKQYETPLGDGVAALRNVSLTIRKGEYIGVLGMNGSGKSTLARLLNGLIKPTEGKVYVNGLSTDKPANLTEIRRSVGMLFQNPDNQLVCPVVEEEIAFGLENLGLPLPEIRRRIEWALYVCGLEDKRYHAPHLLSGGQKQMVALASVLAMLPEYLVLDEPTSMLDPISRRNLIAQLQVLNKEEGVTVIFISHNPEDLIQADRLIVLEQGSVYMDGTPRDVFLSEEIRNLELGRPAVYQLIGELEASGLTVPSNVKSIDELVGYICLRL
ncbi:energy-coupling factor transporter ATPase [Syntrophothermus lipocalidus]|uniref:ABC transporter related protein n=1 Tax=Syntrophothermus lipocalidus (strain DSM 12680 / TGB-C1) TaxID=643648 RepID=D7CJC1_SYNLT|nr:energy-coupling factor transporter ATPase [Syntrophothermus lipocalidus]ADI01010.1 ABC transporter related protein [Syntrophothermus lipocalidus DSM 12680]